MVLAAAPPAGWVALLGGLAVLGLVVLDGVRHPGADAVEVERELPRTLSVGEPGTVVLRVRNRLSAPLRIQIADGCPAALDPEQEVLDCMLAPGAVQRLEYTVRPTARGAFPFQSTHLRLQRPRALATWQTQLAPAGEARVHPNLRNLARYDLRARRELLQSVGGRQTRVAGRDGDFERLRDFVSGDDLRHVDWRATARMRRPITRVYQTEQAQTIVLLVDGTRLMGARAAGLSKLDHAVNAALMLAWVGLQKGDRVAVGVFDDGLRAWLPPQRGVTQFGRVLDLLFDQQPRMSFPRYREAARRVVLDVRRRALVIWLTDLFDGEQGRELIQALRALRRRHLSLVVAMDDPGVHAIADQDPSDTRALFERAGAAELLAEREALLRRLHIEGAQVVDKQPEDVAAALVDRYLDLKARGAL